MILFNPFFSRQNHCFWERNGHSTSIFANVWSQTKYILCNFHPLGVVGRDIETQLQVGEN